MFQWSLKPRGSSHCKLVFPRKFPPNHIIHLCRYLFQQYLEDNMWLENKWYKQLSYLKLPLSTTTRMFAIGLFVSVWFFVVVGFFVWLVALVFYVRDFFKVFFFIKKMKNDLLCKVSWSKLPQYLAPGWALDLLSIQPAAPKK